MIEDIDSSDVKRKIARVSTGDGMIPFSKVVKVGESFMATGCWFCGHIENGAGDTVPYFLFAPGFAALDITYSTA